MQEDEKLLPQLKNDDQKGFLEGRYTGEIIRLLYGTPLYASKHHVPGLLLMVGFEKAFDSVPWSFTEQLLTSCNFGQDIKRWISTFYINIKPCVSVNGQRGLT